VKLFVGARSRDRLRRAIGGVDVVEDLLKVGGERDHCPILPSVSPATLRRDNDV